MSTGNELTLAEDFILGVLNPDAQLQALCGDPLRIFQNEVPVNETYPFIVFAEHSNEDVVTVNTARVMVTAEYLIQAIAVGASWTPDQLSAAARIDSLLTGILVPVTGGVVHGCRRVQEYRMVEQVEGKLIRHVGGIYHVWVQSLP